MKKRFGISFMIIGLALILLAIGLLFYNNYENKIAKEQSNDIVHSLLSFVDKEKIEEKIDPFDTEMRVVEIDGYGYIGYLTIPDLDLNLPVMDHWDYPRLKIAPCRYYGSAKTDNLVIAAHNYKSHFGYIGKLSVGSMILFTDMEGTDYVYTVNAVEILQPTDVDQVKDTGDDLILYTCTYNGRTRVAVRCSRKSS